MTQLLYSLHSGNLYGTERMALATALGLRDEFETTIIAPAGPVHAEARSLGFQTIVFENPLQYVAAVRPFFAKRERIAAVGTRVLHTLAANLWSSLYFCQCANIQVVHGGADEHLSYGRKRFLNRLNTKQVAVSNYVKDRMIAHGIDANRVHVIENFLTPERIQAAIRRQKFTSSGLNRVAIVSRLDPIKRIDLLLDALDLEPQLRHVSFDIYGSGSEEAALRDRAARSHPNVQFHGFRCDVAEGIADADLLLHLCPEEPFGLAILEAMAALLPVMVPNSGGAGDIVEPGRNGFHFHANDARDLATRLLSISQAPVEALQSVVEAGQASLEGRFSSQHGANQYRKLIHECLA